MKTYIKYRWIMTVAMLLGAFATSAAANSFFAAETTIAPGTTGEIEFLLDNDQPTYGLQAVIELPSGLEFAATSGNPELALSERATGFSIVSNLTSARSINLGLLSTAHDAFNGNSGVLLTATVKASDDFAGGLVKVSGIRLTKEDHTEINDIPDTSTTISRVIAVTGITLSKTSETLQVDQTLELTITEIKPANATDKSVTWTSSDDSVATVDADGKVTATGLGVATITVASVSDPAVKAECKVTVVRTPVTSIALSKTTETLQVDQTLELTITEITPANATDKSVTWTSSDDSVATVDADGKVTAIGLGVATITVASVSDPTVKAECKVTVVRTPVTGITISKTAETLQADQTLELTITEITPANATDKSVTWTSSDDSVATVGTDGKVTATGLGVATITVASVSDPTVKAECKVTVVRTPVTGITLSKEAASLEKGGQVSLGYTIIPANATDKSITWSSSNETVATVDADGTVTALELGTADIIARSVSDPDVTGKCLVSVVPTPATGITVEPDYVELQAGESASLDFSVLPANATDQTVKWSVADEEIATVDEYGTVTAVSVGTTTVIATSSSDSSIKGECVVKVIPTPVEDITLNLNDAELKVGEGLLLTATVYPANATDKTVAWTSSDSDIVRVDGDGNVVAVALGEAVVTASCGGFSAGCRISVVPTPAEKVILSKSYVSLKVGESMTLTAKVLPDTTTDKTVAWSSSDEEIVTVDKNGRLKAVALGNATIFAACGNAMAACDVTVVRTPVSGIKIDQDSVEVKLGKTLKLNARVSPYNATDKTVRWTSSDKEVATVNAFGFVKGISLGEAEIIAMCGNVADTCKVTVVPVLAESLKVTPEEWSGEEGSSFVISAELLPYDTTDKSLAWESSDEQVATVDETGTVRVLKAGTCVITVSTLDGSDLTAECLITGISGVDGIFEAPDAALDVYDMNGVMVKKGCTREELRHLTPGMYIIRSGGKSAAVMIGK